MLAYPEFMMFKKKMYSGNGLCYCHVLSETCSAVHGYVENLISYTVSYIFDRKTCKFLIKSTIYYTSLSDIEIYIK